MKQYSKKNQLKNHIKVQRFQKNMELNSYSFFSITTNVAEDI